MKLDPDILMVILQDSILNGYYLLAGCKVAKNN